MEALAYRKLSPEESQARLAEAPGWSIENDKLSKSFKFKSYKDGVVFATAVAYLADRLDHHPDLQIGYAQVRVAMNTHSVEGLSPYDFELARRIEAIL